MPKKPFFDAASDQSAVKSKIVAKYFAVWSKIMLANLKRYGGSKLVYVDLYAGPGRYADGSDSTPLLVLKQALRSDDLSRVLVTIFNDRDSDKTATLETAIRGLPRIDSLTHAPEISNDDVDERVAAAFEGIEMAPTFAFVDPWGYSGLTLRLLRSLFKDWGSDCLFFFNYNRINMGIANDVVASHMDALFGAAIAARLRQELAGREPDEREALIVEALCEALRSRGGKYVLPFRFRRDDGRSSHHLVFVSKNVRGYTIMKDIMASESSEATQGVPSFEYHPAYERSGLLFELSRPLEDLGEMLLSEFAGEALTRRQIFDRHHVDRPFVEKNYRECLLALEEAGAVACRPEASKRRMYKGARTMAADKVLIMFPARGAC